MLIVNNENQVKVLQVLLNFCEAYKFMSALPLWTVITLTNFGHCNNSQRLMSTWPADGSQQPATSSQQSAVMCSCVSACGTLNLVRFWTLSLCDSRDLCTHTQGHMKDVLGVLFVGRAAWDFKHISCNKSRVYFKPAGGPN